MAKIKDCVEAVRLAKKVLPKNAARKIRLAGWEQGKIVIGDAIIGARPVYGLYKLYEHHKNADKTKTKNTNNHKMTLKEAYTKVKEDYNDWIFGPILEKEDYFLFSGHPINGENDMIFEIPGFIKESQKIELIDISKGIDKTIRKINPEDL